MPSKTPVIVDVALYHGATQLCDSSSTTPQPVNGLLRIKETITFKIAKKDVPKVSKFFPYTNFFLQSNKNFVVGFIFVFFSFPAVCKTNVHCT